MSSIIKSKKGGKDQVSMQSTTIPARTMGTFTDVFQE